MLLSPLLPFFRYDAPRAPLDVYCLMLFDYFDTPDVTLPCFVTFRHASRASFHAAFFFFRADAVTSRHY